jgi:hypothetical protein
MRAARTTTELRIALASVTALLVATAGCTSTAPRSPNPSAAAAADVAKSTAPVAVEKNLQELLADSLAIDGRGGYFVDDAWSVTRSPFSVYETYWQVRWRDGALPEGMRAERLEPWVAVGAEGRLRSSSLQQVGQIMFAAGVARLLGMKLDRARAGAALERLRDGYLYSPDEGAEGNWGTTAAAVRAMSDLSLPVPAETVRQARRAVSEVPATMDPQAVVSTVLPLLEVLTFGRDPGADPGDVPRVASAALAALESIPASSVDISWLGARYQLEQVRTAAGLPPRSLGSDRCAALVTPGGYVVLPGQESADTQGTFYARQLGCQNVVKELKRPYTRAGWLLGSAVDPVKTLAATAAALKIAEIVGGAQHFAATIRPSVPLRWRPLLADRELSAQIRPVMAFRLSYVTALTGAVVSDVPGAGAAGDDLVGLLTADGQESKVRAATAFLAKHEGQAAGQASMDVAAGYFLAGTYLNDQAALARAAELAARLRLSEDVYKAVECGTADAACQEPSIMASAIGSWIGKAERAPRLRWQELGLCHGYVCADRYDDGVSLRQLFAAVACGRLACGREFPLIP